MHEHKKKPIHRVQRPTPEGMHDAQDSTKSAFTEVVGRDSESLFLHFCRES